MPMAIPVIQVIAAVAAVASLAIALSMKQPKVNNGVNDSGSTNDTRGKQDPRILAFGNTRVPASKIFSNVNCRNQRYLAQVHHFGIGPLGAITDIWIDEQRYQNWGGNMAPHSWYGFNWSNNFPNVGLGVNLGQTTEQAYGQIIGNSDNLWSANHRGDRVPSVSILVERRIDKNSQDSQYRLMSPNFKVEASVIGNAVIDPRMASWANGIDDVNARVWKNGSLDSYRNPACVILTYLVDKYYGMAMPVDAINVNSFIALANYCDANNFYFDGWIDQSKTWGEILTQFATSFDGLIYLENGQVCVKPNTQGVAVYNVTESDMIGNMQLSNAGNEYWNAVKVDFNNANNKHEKDAAVLPVGRYTDPTIQQDGKVIEKTFNMPFTSDPNIVKRFANRQLKQAKLCRRSVDFKVSSFDFPNFKIGTVFTIEHGLYQLTKANNWIVTQIESTLDEKVMELSIKAVEFDNRVFDTSTYDDPVFGSSLPDPSFVVDAPQNLVFTQNNTLNIGTGVLSWQCSYSGTARWEVQYKRSSSTEWVEYGETPTESMLISSMQAGEKYDFRVRTAAVVGSSYWAELEEVKVNRNLTLPAPQNVVADFSGPSCVFTWDAITGSLDSGSVVSDGITDLSQCLHYYEIAVSHGTTLVSTYRATQPRFEYTYAENLKNGLSRDVRVSVRGVSIWGDAGTAATKNAFNQPMATPSGVVVRSQLVNFTVQWNNPSDQISDYEATDVYIVPNAITLPSVQYQIGTSSTGQFTMILPDALKTGYVVVAHRDVFGHSSPIAGSAPVYFTETTIDDLLTDASITDELAEAKKDILDNATSIIKNSTSIKKVSDDLTTANGQISTVKTLAESTAGTVSQLQTTVTGHTGSINSLQTVTSGHSGSLSALQTTVTNQGNSITNLQSVTTTIDGKVQALNTIQLDVNGYVSGLKMANDGSKSTVDFITDVFRVGPTNNAKAVFEIRDGNVMMKNALIGNLTATNIDVGSLTGDRFAAGSFITVGSGNTSATLSGSNVNWRLWAGHSDPASAPFRVSNTGVLTATGANITGHITATSGTFAGTINADKGYFNNGTFANGTFNTATINGATINTGTFRNVTIEENCVVKGTVYADKIVGDISLNFNFRGKAPADSYVVPSRPASYSFQLPASARNRTLLVANVRLTITGDDYDGSNYDGIARITTTVAGVGTATQDFQSYYGTGALSARFTIPAGVEPHVTITVTHRNSWGRTFTEWQDGIAFTT